MLKYEIVPHQDIDLPSLYIYSKIKKHALGCRAKFSSMLKSSNDILVQYEQHYPELMDAIAKLRMEIRLNTSGVPDVDGLSSVGSEGVHNKSGRLSAAEEVQKNRFFRSLAKVHHPDKGGKVEDFQAIQQAYKEGDLDYLRVQFTLLRNDGNLSWRCSTEGINFWLTQAEKASVNLRTLQGLPMFRVVMWHMSGNYSKADLAMESELLMRKASLTLELRYILGSNNISQTIMEKHNGVVKEEEVQEREGQEECSFEESLSHQDRG